jgi:hypothetical protein
LILVESIEYTPNLFRLPIAGYSRLLAEACATAAESRNPFAASNRLKTQAIRGIAQCWPREPRRALAIAAGVEEMIARKPVEWAYVRHADAPEAGAAGRAIAIQFVNRSLRRGKNAAISRTACTARRVRWLQRKLRCGGSLASQKSILTNVQKAIWPLTLSNPIKSRSFDFLYVNSSSVTFL